MFFLRHHFEEHVVVTWVLGRSALSIQRDGVMNLLALCRNAFSSKRLCGGVSRHRPLFEHCDAFACRSYTFSGDADGKHIRDCHRAVKCCAYVISLLKVGGRLPGWPHYWNERLKRIRAGDSQPCHITIVLLSLRIGHALRFAERHLRHLRSFFKLSRKPHAAARWRARLCGLAAHNHLGSGRNIILEFPDLSRTNREQSP